MRYLNVREGKGSEAVVILEHKGEQLSWNIKTYLKFKPQDDLEKCTGFVVDINRFWSILPESRQDVIWNAYKNCFNAFADCKTFQDLNKVLREELRIMFDQIIFDEVMIYVRRDSNIKFPLGLKTVVEEDYIRAITYLKDEYEELVGMCILLRMLVPIWSVYYDSCRSDTGDKFRELAAIRLLSRSAFIDFPPYRRLEHYCESYWEGNKKQMAASAILDGLGTVAAPSFLVSLVLFKKLSVINIPQRTDPEDAKDMLATIYHVVKNLTDDFSKVFDDRISEKFGDNKGDRDEDQSSVAENYKIKQANSEGEIAAHDFFGKYYDSIVSRFVPQEDRAKFDQFYLEAYDHIRYQEIDVVFLQKALCQWVLSPVVSARSMDYVSYNTLLTYVVITQSLLWYWNFPQLASLMTAKMTKSDRIFNHAGRIRLSNEQMDILDKHYPHQINGMKSKLDSRKKKNFAMTAICTLSDHVQSSMWTMRMSPTLCETLQIEDGTRIPVLPDIEYQLGELIIFKNKKEDPTL